MATLTVQQMIDDGLEPTYAAADVAGDEFTWSSKAFLHVKNGDANPHTVTVASQYTNLGPGLQTLDLAVAIPANEERMIGPLAESAFKDSTGLVQVTYDAVTSATVAAITL